MSDAARDPGPMARLDALVKDPTTMDVIVQRMTEPDGPESLAQIAKAWQVPYGRLSAWITESKERTQQYLNALQIRAETMAHEVVPIADGIDTESKNSATKAKIQIDARLRLAGKWAPGRYGDATNVNVALKDDRVMDRDTLILEAARGIAFLLSQGGEIASAREPQRRLPATIEMASTAPAPAARGPI